MSGIPAILALVVQTVAAPDTSDLRELRAGLELTYAGRFDDAVAHFAERSHQTPHDPSGPIFQANAIMWWAQARQDDGFGRDTVLALLDEAVRRAEQLAHRRAFWLATAYGYRARQHELYGHPVLAARDADRMRELFAAALGADSGCADCYLGLGLYDYGMARAPVLARFFADLLGFAAGDAERGLVRMRHAAEHGDLARTEARWVLASALRREGAGEEARSIVSDLARRYPDNPVFRAFLDTTEASAER